MALEVAALLAQEEEEDLPEAVVEAHLASPMAALQVFPVAAVAAAEVVEDHLASAACLLLHMRQRTHLPSGRSRARLR